MSLVCIDMKACQCKPTFINEAQISNMSRRQMMLTTRYRIVIPCFTKNITPSICPKSQGWKSDCRACTRRQSLGHKRQRYRHSVVIGFILHRPAILMILVYGKTRPYSAGAGVYSMVIETHSGR
jgi:hypothetical protein